jgi:hypothetical protein
MTFSTLICTHVQTQLAFDIVSKAISTHQATCESLLHVWDHDRLEGSSLNAQLEALCQSLGASYLYLSEPYHQTRWWNRFIQNSEADYLALSSADVIFYPGWLDEIKYAITYTPGLLSYHPVTVSRNHCGLSYVNSPSALEPHRVVINANPLCHVIVTPKIGAHVWDEQFPYWEADMDYHLTMERGPRKAGICRGSRVDHLDGSQIRDSASHYPIGYHEARGLLEKKWGLNPVGEFRPLAHENCK